MGDQMSSEAADGADEVLVDSDATNPQAGSPQRKRLLVQTVGTGPNVHKSLLKSIEDQRPDRVLQLCTHGSFYRDSGEKDAPSPAPSPSTIDAFDGEWAGRATCQVERVAFYIDEEERDAVVGWAARCLPASPNLLQELMRGFETAIRDAVRELGDCEVLLDFTSGTKAMSAALVAVGRDLGADSFLYVSGPREPESGRVFESETVESVARAPLTIAARLEQLHVLFANHRFSAIEREAESLIAVAKEQRSHHRRRDIEALRDLAKICDLWDRFQWAETKRLLDEIGQKRLGKLDAAGWPAHEIERWRGHVSRVVASEVGMDRLIDLLANAERRSRDGAHDDAVARCYRLCEYIAQVRLGERLSDAGDKLKDELDFKQWTTLPRDAKELIERDYCRREADGSPFKGPLRLGLDGLHRVLEACGDPYGQSFMDDYGRQHSNLGELGHLLKVRNKSFLAHGSRPVDRSTAERLFEWCVTLLARHGNLNASQIRQRLDGAAFPRNTNVARSSGVPS